MTAREVLDGIKAEAKGLTDLCPEHLRQSIRHVQRNCDIECNEHPNGDHWLECHQPDRYDGERMAKSLGNIERLTRAVEAVLALAGQYDHEANRLTVKAERFIPGEVRSRYLGEAADARLRGSLIRAAIENALNP